MDKKHFLIEKAFDGELSSSEQSEYQALLQNDTSFAKLVRDRSQLAELIGTQKNKSFSPFFVDQLIKEIGKETASKMEESSLAQSLMWTFKRVAFASAFAVIALVSINTVGGDSANSDQSFVERAFDIPVVTIDAAQEDFGSLIP